MKHIKLYNESEDIMEMSGLSGHEERLKEIDRLSSGYKYYVGSTSSRIYPLYHGTFRGFNTHEEVLKYISTIEKTALLIKIFSPEEYKKVEDARKQGS